VPHAAAMHNAHDPPGFIAASKWTSLHRPFELPERAEVSQTWIVEGGRLRPDLDANRTRDVKQYEEGAVKMATGQLMMIGQALFMMWMMGSGLSLWSIMLLCQGGLGPFFALYRTGEGACYAARAPPPRPRAASVHTHASPLSTSTLPRPPRSLRALCGARRAPVRRKGHLRCNKPRRLLVYAVEVALPGGATSHVRGLGAPAAPKALPRVLQRGVWAVSSLVAAHAQ
jgi:hypothetical protein